MAAAPALLHDLQGVLVDVWLEGGCLHHPQSGQHMCQAKWSVLYLEARHDGLSIINNHPIRGHRLNNANLCRRSISHALALLLPVRISC